MSSRVRAGAFVIVGALMLPAVSVAQTEAEMAEVMERDAAAQEHFNAEDYAAALEDLEAAQAILPDTGRLYNIAVCYDRLERLQEALDAYQRYLDAPDALGEQRADSRTRIAAIRAIIDPDSVRDPDEGGAGAGGTGGGGEGPVEPAPRGLVPPLAFYLVMGVTVATGVVATVIGSLMLRDQNEVNSLQSRRDELEAAHDAEELTDAEYDAQDQPLYDRQAELAEQWRPYIIPDTVLFCVAGAAAAATVVLAVLAFMDFTPDATSAVPTLAFAPAPGGGHFGATFTF